MTYPTPGAAERALQAAEDEARRLHRFNSEEFWQQVSDRKIPRGLAADIPRR